MSDIGWRQGLPGIKGHTSGKPPLTPVTPRADGLPSAKGHVWHFADRYVISPSTAG